MTITNKAFRNAMENAGLADVQLEKNGCYFYIWSDDEETANLILKLESTSILTHAFKDMSVEEWVETIKAMMKEAREAYYDDLEDRPIIIKANWKN